MADTTRVDPKDPTGSEAFQLGGRCLDNPGGDKLIRNAVVIDVVLVRGHHHPRPQREPRPVLGDAVVAVRKAEERAENTVEVAPHPLMRHPKSLSHELANGCWPAG